MNFPGGKRDLQRLVDQFYVPLFRYAYRLTGSEAEAEDLTQDTFCSAQEKYFQLRDKTKEKPWLFSILRNGYLHLLRNKKKEPTVNLDLVGDVPDTGAEAPFTIDSQTLQRAIAELPEVFRTPVILFFFEDFSYREIAEQMDLPLGTVMSRLARAKSFLRAKLVQSSPEVIVGNRRANDGL